MQYFGGQARTLGAPDSHALYPPINILTVHHSTSFLWKMGSISHFHVLCECNIHTRYDHPASRLPVSIPFDRCGDMISRPSSHNISACIQIVPLGAIHVFDVLNSIPLHIISRLSRVTLDDPRTEPASLFLFREPTTSLFAGHCLDFPFVSR